jgi:hypothetical protein
LERVHCVEQRQLGAVGPYRGAPPGRTGALQATTGTVRLLASLPTWVQFNTEVHKEMLGSDIKK